MGAWVGAGASVFEWKWGACCTVLGPARAPRGCLAAQGRTRGGLCDEPGGEAELLVGWEVEGLELAVS